MACGLHGRSSNVDGWKKQQHACFCMGMRQYVIWDFLIFGATKQVHGNSWILDLGL